LEPFAFSFDNAFIKCNFVSVGLPVRLDQMQITWNAWKIPQNIPLNILPFIFLAFVAEEADTILNGMEDLTERLFQEKKTVKRLEVDNEDLTKKIYELQNQLEKNRSKMSESQEKCENLECHYEEEKQRLALVEDTIKTIRQSKDRVKMLVNNFAPSLNLDQFD
jgi:vacuolar-type H+-ATPase subunit I/STV1